MSLFTNEQIAAARQAVEGGEMTWWKANTVGDKIEGLFISRNTADTDFGPREVIYIDAEEAFSQGAPIDKGRYTVRLSAVLKQRADEATLMPGQTWVLIEFLGKAESKSGREYKRFSMATMPAPEERHKDVPEDHGEFEDDIPF